MATKILPLPAPAHSEQDTSASGFEEAAEPSMFNVIQVPLLGTHAVPCLCAHAAMSGGVLHWLCALMC